MEKMEKMEKLTSILIVSGSAAIVLALIIFVLIFYPVIGAELNYQIQVKTSGVQSKSLEPIDMQFGIVIPKIFANTKVIANVDPFNQKEYQLALTQGVAHAKGTVFPGEIGNIFLFSHSSVNFYEANRYNSIFYLLDKLNPGDEIDLYYKGEKFKYRINDKKIASAQDIQYLWGKSSKKTIILMTCWPAGTALKRLLVMGELDTN